MAPILVAPPETVDRLQRRCRPGTMPHAVSTGEAIRRLATADHGVLVFDPVGLRGDVFGAMLDAIRNTRMDVLLYTTPGGIGRAMQVTSPYPIELVIAGTDDDTDTLTALLSVGGPSVLGLVRAALLPIVASLPVPIRVPLHSLLAWGPFPASAEVFARCAGRSLSTVNRWLAGRGVAPVSDLLAAANLARLHFWLRSRSGTVEDICSRYSAVTPRQLASKCREMVGLPLRRAAIEFSADHWAAKIAAHLLKGNLTRD